MTFKTWFFKIGEGRAKRAIFSQNLTFQEHLYCTDLNLVSFEKRNPAPSDEMW